MRVTYGKVNVWGGEYVCHLQAFVGRVRRESAGNSLVVRTAAIDVQYIFGFI